MPVPDGVGGDGLAAGGRGARFTRRGGAAGGAAGAEAGAGEREKPWGIIEID